MFTYVYKGVPSLEVVTSAVAIVIALG